MKILYHFIATNKRLKVLKKTTKIVISNFGRFFLELWIFIVPIILFGTIGMKGRFFRVLKNEIFTTEPSSDLHLDCTYFSSKFLTYSSISPG